MTEIPETTLDLIDILEDPEDAYPGNFDTPQRANALLFGLCQGAAEEIRKLRRALAQPEQEPVAWGCNRYIEDDNGFQIGTDEPELAWGKYAPDDNGWWPLYTTPPQRKPLTDEEVRKHLAIAKSHEQTWLMFARAIEAAHGIKGEA